MKTNRMCAFLGNLHNYEGLAPLTDHRPVATLPFDSKYRLIDFNLSSIANSNIHSVFMVFNYDESRSVFDHLGGGTEWNLDGINNRFFIHLFEREAEKMKDHNGYYDAVIDYLEKAKSKYMVYFCSKVLCNIDLKALLNIHLLHEDHSDLTVVYKKMPKEDIYDTDLVLNFNEDGKVASKTSGKDVAEGEIANLCTDIYIVKVERLLAALRQSQKEGVWTHVESCLRSMIDENTTAYEYTGYLSNIFDVKSYYKANMDMLTPAKFNSLMYANQKIYTKVHNEFPTYYSDSAVVNNAQFGTGCEVEGEVVHSILGRTVVVKQGAKIEDSLVHSSCVIGEGAKIQYAILDKNCKVADHVSIIGTPENPVVVSKASNVTEDIIGG